MPDENKLAVSTQSALATDQLSQFLGIPRDVMIDTIKAQCFRNAKEPVTNAQLAAFITIAVEMKVNPLLPGMLYAFADRGAIFPIMGPDGVYKKLAESPVIDSWETTVYPEDVNLPPTHATTKIWRKSSERPLTYTALISEWRMNSNPNWAARPRHMLALRSLKHAARQVIHGIPGDEDDRAIAEINVTPQPGGAPAVKRDEPPKRATGVASSRKANVVEAELVPEAKAEVVQSRTELNPGERPTLVSKVVSFKCDEIKTSDGLFPSVIAEVAGEFTGKVYHINGATKEGDVFKPNPAWVEGARVTLCLFGKPLTPTTNPDGSKTPRKPAVMVESIMPTETVAPTAPAKQETSSEVE